jgi:hypothetical protein
MKKHCKRLVGLFTIVVLFSSCKKVVEKIVEGSNAPQKGQFYEYIIRQGQHSADYNAYKSVQYEELKFVVRFDNSAHYQSANANNQEDINKLYGFSDNNAGHQQYSARFGWNWARGSLRLYAYVYNNGVRSSQEITAIKVGQEYTCTLKVLTGKYVFAVNDASLEMPRASSGTKAEGYRLYPYFGGDEIAPHDVHIWIREL